MELFEASARQYPELGDFVRREVENLLRSRDTANGLSQGRSDCLFATSAAYISLVLSLLPRLADRLLKSPLIEDYIDSQVAEVDATTDFSDLTPITDLTERERGLRLLVERLKRLVDEFSKRPIIPSQPGRLASEPSALHPRSISSPTFPPLSTLIPSIPSPLDDRPPTTQPYLPQNMPVRPSMSREGFNPLAKAAYGESIRVDTPRDGLESPDLVPEQPPIARELVDANQLAHRGKGRHTCPHAFRCTKGGVNADGTLVIFERNSHFRY
ncbi:uncharacterized protein C8A04DRAFT_30657 [Dichotomopilus funicola]|uniref:Uncharacterized protein n=1 Tax=Dichotomopilus funicola TaxID=1934379 RepID=A0AAN6UYZ3_9PEZI|nr:hypothetical protein C8A04DRAFT_30657 [Dichotomopilus funicola]